MNKTIKVSRETFIVVLLLIISFTNISPIVLRASDLAGVTADEYLIADRKSGVVYSEKNSNEVHGIASITKLMAAYVYFDKIKADSIDLNTAIPVTDRALALSMNPTLSGVYFNYNEEFSLNEMLKLMLVYSDNGACESIGEKLFGSEEAVVKKMNEKAKQLNLTKTKYYNSTGLTMRDYGDYQLKGSKPDDYNVSTARECLKLTNSLINTHPEVLDYVKEPTVNFKGETLSSYNLMLPGLTFEYSGVVGMKTGSSNEAKDCFIGYFIDPKTHIEYLSAILGTDSESQRFAQTTMLYNYVTDLKYNVIKPDDYIISEKIDSSSNELVSLKPVVRYNLPDTFIFNGIKVGEQFNPKYFNENNKLIRDIPKGENVVTYTYKFINNNDAIDNLYSDNNTFKVPFVANTEIKKENIFQNIYRSFIDFIIDLYS